MEHSLVLVMVTAIVGCVLTVSAEAKAISTAQEFIDLFAGYSGETLETDIELLADLDFSGSSLTLPLGAFSNGTCVAYSGVLQGNGHSIKGFAMDSTNNEGYNDAGLFCNLTDATIENLVIDSSCSFTGRYAGALSTSVGGSLIVRNTTNKAAVTGSGILGGFIGQILSLIQPAVVLFENCVNDGTVTGYEDVIGGFVGTIRENTHLTITISNSTNNGIVTGRNIVGGFVGDFFYNSNTALTISNSVNNGNVTGTKSGSVGGFVGEFHYNTDITMTISNSVNNGNVTGNGEDVGGFVGYINGNTNMTMTISNYTNNGKIIGDSGVGGFVGYMEVNKNTTITFSHSTNSGNVTASQGGAVGGFVGYVDDNENTTITLSYSANNGNVTGQIATGGFVGYMYRNKNTAITLSHSTNSANVTASQTGAVGGFVGDVDNNENTTITLSYSANNGNVTGKIATGGFVGFTTSNTDVIIGIFNSVNNGIVHGEQALGGLVGGIELETNSHMTISNSTNNAFVNGSDWVGGFVGIISLPESYSMSLVIINSANKGTVSANNALACGLFYVHIDYNFNVSTTVINSINKGSVYSSTNAYGITNNITTARNVVSMGEVTGPSGSYTFWNASTDVDLFYGLDSNCSNCSANATLFKLNTTTGFYEVVGSGEHVHSLLNIEATNHHFGMLWSKELELVETSDIEPTSSSMSVPLSGAAQHAISSLCICLALALTLHVTLMH